MIRWGWIFPIGCFASSATSVAWELAASRPLVIAGDALPVFIGAPPYPRPCGRVPRRLPTGVYWRLPGSLAPVREHDARGSGGGFAALGASLRRVAGVSRL